MKIESIKREDGGIIHSNDFEDLYELVSYIKMVKPFSEKWNLSSEMISDERSEFTGTASLDEALDLCLNSYNSNEVQKILDFSEQLKEIFPKLGYNRRIEHSNYGFRPDIYRALHSNPNSMYKLVRKPKPRFIDIYFNVSTAINVSKEAIMNKGIITMALIKFLERSNYRVNLNLFSLSYASDEAIYIKVSLKSPSQLLDVNTCCFPMIHPSFNRRIFFAITERVDIENVVNWAGYGRPADREFTINTLELDENAIILDSPTNLEIEGKDLVEDTINLVNNSNLCNCLGENQSIEYDEGQKKFILKY